MIMIRRIGTLAILHQIAAKKGPPKLAQAGRSAGSWRRRSEVTRFQGAVKPRQETVDVENGHTRRPPQGA